MDAHDIRRHRLFNQQLTRPRFATPQDLISWFGAVQAQDYGSATWAVGQRVVGATDDSIQDAFTDGSILRTHVLRPTWHFVAPRDIRWMLALTGPRVLATVAGYLYRVGLDTDTVNRGIEIVVRELQGGNQCTRSELGAALQERGLATDGLRLTFLLMKAELDGVICSGPRRGKQFTYMLLDERVPPGKSLNRTEALVELTRRYFQSHGPATVYDFAWWSGLTVGDGRSALSALASHLAHARVDGKDYHWLPANLPDVSPAAYLLPIYDEYGVAYRDRSAFTELESDAVGANSRRVPFVPMIVLDGQTVGRWERSINRGSVSVKSTFFVSPSNIAFAALRVAAEQYGRFLGKVVTLEPGDTSNQEG